jgi:hypothetical protein
MTGQVRVRVTPFTAWILDTTKESGLEVLVGGWEPFDLWVCVSAQPVISRRFPLHDGRETGGRGTRALPSELAIGSIPDRRGEGNSVRTSTLQVRWFESVPASGAGLPEGLRCDHRSSWRRHQPRLT